MVEAAPKIILPDEEVKANFANAVPPSGPPNPQIRNLPDRLRPIEKFLAELVAEEGLLMDLVIERSIEIVEFNHNAGLAGADYFNGNADGAGAAPRTQIVALAMPVAVALYAEVVKSLNTPENREKFAALAAEANPAA